MPDVTEQLVDQIQQARSEQRSLMITGQGSKRHYGRDSRCDKRLDLTKHCGIIEYQPEELVLTVRAGTSLSDIDEVLEPRGQMLVGEPPRYGGSGTIGGSVACNISGPSRPWTGSLRDSVLGVQLIDGSGSVLRFGGRVIKNVAGYDVSRLQCGALGCLGVISEISLRVTPRPASSKTIILPIDDHQDALEHMSIIGLQSTPTTGICWINGELFVRFQGSVKAVEKAMSDYLVDWPGAKETETDSSLWASVRDHSSKYFSSDVPLWRLSVHPAKSVSTERPDIVDWGGRTRWIYADATMSEMAELAAAMDGQACLFRGALQGDEVFHPLTDELKRLHQGLKAKFDPDGLFNPGRLYSWL